MPRIFKALFVLLPLWILTGIYVVGGNERAAVRRFGRAIIADDGALVLKSSGLYFDWPWPLSRVDRINLAEVRTLSVPLSASDDDSSPLLVDDATFDPAYLTGDKNLLEVRLSVHYRIAESGAREFLFGSVTIEDRLACLVQAVTADLLSQSGVDFAQVSGLSELRGELSRHLQQQTDQQELGLVIEDVILEEVSPPIQVKADFLDVANARADREQSIQSALSLVEQRRQSALAEARQIRDAAFSQGQQTLQSAKGSAARFLQIIAAYQNADSPGTTPNSLARRLVLEQQYIQAVSEILERIQGKVVLDSGQELDLTIWRSLPNSKSVTDPTNAQRAPTDPNPRD